MLEVLVACNDQVIDMSAYDACESVACVPGFLALMIGAFAVGFCLWKWWVVLNCDTNFRYRLCGL